MKKSTTLLLALFLLVINANAQSKFGDRKDKIKALKIAYITNELALTSDEASKFWPIFNAFDDKQQEIREGKSKAFLKKSTDEEFDQLSEKEASTMLTQIETSENEMFQNKKNLIAKLKGVLPAVKILKLKRAEENFGKKLLQQYKKRD